MKGLVAHGGELDSFQPQQEAWRVLCVLTEVFEHSLRCCGKWNWKSTAEGRAAMLSEESKESSAKQMEKCDL